MCGPALFPWFATAGSALGGAGATTSAVAGVAKAGLGAAAAKGAATALGSGLAAKALAPKMPSSPAAPPPENTDPSGKIASLDARRRAKLAGGRQSTLLTRNTGPVTPGQKTLLGS